MSKNFKEEREKRDIVEKKLSDITKKYDDSKRHYIDLKASYRDISNEIDKLKGPNNQESSSMKNDASLNNEKEVKDKYENLKKQFKVSIYKDKIYLRC